MVRRQKALRLNYLDRTIAAIEQHHQADPDKSIKVEDICDIVHRNARDIGEGLGARYETSVKSWLIALRLAGYIASRRQSNLADPQHIRLTDDGKRLMRRIRSQGDDGATPIEKHHALIERFRVYVPPRSIRLPTRAEIDFHLRRAERRERRHAKRCPLLQGSGAVVPTVSNDQEDESAQDTRASTAPGTPLNNWDDDEMDQDMDMDEAGPPHVPAALSCTPSHHTIGGLLSPGLPPMDVDEDPAPLSMPGSLPMPRTPLHRSGSLNNPHAYPSPASMERPTASGSGSSRSQSAGYQTPSRRSLSPFVDDGESTSSHDQDNDAAFSGIAGYLWRFANALTGTPVRQRPSLSNREAVTVQEEAEAFVAEKDTQIMRLRGQVEESRKEIEQLKEDAEKLREQIRKLEEDIKVIKSKGEDSFARQERIIAKLKQREVEIMAAYDKRIQDLQKPLLPPMDDSDIEEGPSNPAT